MPQEDPGALGSFYYLIARMDEKQFWLAKAGTADINGRHMSLRYIIRRQNPEDLSEVKKVDSHLDKTLGPAAENLRRFIQTNFNTAQYAVYHCMTTKKGETWSWVCPSIELVAETHSDFMELTERFHVPRTQLSHFPSKTA